MTRVAWRLSVCIVALVVAGRATTGAQAPGDFTPLFDGQSLAGWVVENSDGANFSVRDGVLRVEGPEGWLRSVQQYGNFDLAVEFRFLTADADSGVFLRAPGPASNIFIRGWPANSYQVQTRDITVNKTMNPIWLGNLYRHRTPPGQTTYDADAVLAVARPTGEWQRFDIDVTDDRILVRLNGVEILQASGLVNPRGYLGLQGETGTVEYRRVDIRPR